MGFKNSMRYKILQMGYGRRRSGVFSKVNKKSFDEMEKQLENLFKPKKDEKK